jgi:RNA polymerase sigma factor (sigma-70 family)
MVDSSLSDSQELDVLTPRPALGPALGVRLESLHARRGQDLFGFARRLGLSAEDSADAVQETMLRLWGELASDTDVRDLDAWAFRTIYHFAVDRHRVGLRLTALLGRLSSKSTAAHTDPVESAEAAMVWRAVDRLPRRQRAVLYLRYRADMSFDQIGLAIGVSPSTARSHATQALAALRRRLGPEEL